MRTVLGRSVVPVLSAVLVGLASLATGCVAVRGGPEARGGTVTAGGTVTPGVEFAVNSDSPIGVVGSAMGQDGRTDEVPVAVPRSGMTKGASPEPVEIVVEGDDSWPRRRSDRRGVSVSTIWIPAMKLKADEDESDAGSGLAFEADLATGQGQAVAVRYRPEDPGLPVLGLTYLWTEHRERDTRNDARAHSVSLDLVARKDLDRDQAIITYLEGSCGLGIAGIDFDGPIDDVFAGGLMLRGVLGVEFFGHGAIELGVGGFHWGYPGESIGSGLFWTLGATVRF